ncbi:MAG: alpha/beta superfamily hydrolase [Arenicella sp.]|jgi:alpha/beta superfamily hydrolase
MHQTINFTNSKNIRLSGVLHLPDTKEIQAYALHAHCFTCTKSIKPAITIANTLAQQGIATLRFDFTGLGAVKAHSQTAISPPTLMM